jgi:two-component sensor histidine kinase
LTVIAFSFFRKAKKRKKEVQEIKHRNRNQLQNLQDVMTTQALLHPKDSEAVKNIQNNIQSLNVLYNLLETSPDGNKINAKKYFSDLVKHLVITFGWNAKNIQINENIAANLIFEGNQTAIPIAQILTELFTNIFKHAFPKDKILEPKIILSLKNIKNEMILELRDNGVGMEHSSASSGTSEGMEITNFFVKNSLKGTINTVSNDNGTKHIIKFPAHV